jgi:glycosyltransferase involved in cell wall biosynthesis
MIYPQRSNAASQMDFAFCAIRRHSQGDMKISVIVPAYNEEKLIPATLAAIQMAMTAFTERGWVGELIVCDNNSTDRTAEIARANGATVVFELQNQIGRARNKGAEAATGDWLVFVDADSHPSRELFADVADAISTGKYFYGGCTLTLDGHYPVGNLVTNLWNWISRIGKYAAGSFIFCDAEGFRTIGGFDIRLFASEELDLCKRLRKLGRQTGKRPIILHRHPLVTSARKIHLYSAREHFLFLFKTVFGGGKTLTSREACHTWYDGRR